MSISPISQDNQLNALVQELGAREMSVDVVSGSNKSYITDQETTALTIRGYAKDAFKHLSEANQASSVVSTWEEGTVKIIYRGQDEVSNLIESVLKEISKEFGSQVKTQEEFNQKVVEKIKSLLPAENLVQTTKV